MIGLDTNVLVRVIVHDDPKQEAVAAKLFDQLGPGNQGYVCLTVMNELAWVLERTYGLDRQAIADALNILLNANDIRIEREDLVASSLPQYLTEKADLADILIGQINHEAGCSTTFTFDKYTAKLSSMSLLTDQSSTSEP